MEEERECPDCRAGYSAAYDVVHEHLAPLFWVDTVPPEVRTITEFLAGRAARPGPFSHDSIDASMGTTKLGLLAGLPENWDACPTCKGSGLTPAPAPTEKEEG